MTVRVYTLHGGPLAGTRLAFGGRPPAEYRTETRRRGRTAVYTLQQTPGGHAYQYDRTE